jgi:hypothetical protein
MRKKKFRTHECKNPTFIHFILFYLLLLIIIILVSFLHVHTQEGKEKFE